VAARPRFGLCTDPALDWAQTVARWRLAEELGFDSAWDCRDHPPPGPPAGSHLEPWTRLAALAAATSRIRVGVLVTCDSVRHPYLLAKAAATIDQVSGGRLEFGLGAAWHAPEHRVLGGELPEPAELVRRFQEAVEICDSLFRNHVTSYSGQHYQLVDAGFGPSPRQRPRPPFTLGAEGPRMLGVVALHADTWISQGTEAQIRERNAVLDAKCAAIGRKPAEVGRALYHPAPGSPGDPWSSADAFADLVGRYRRAGIDDFILDHPPDAQLGVLERVAADLLPQLRR
jgi:alkanesulfonate monooxygenase SsuD/methylene tetrahydromethanopterin reductase-like flavin-dependent oxidoreductase (luciferase family)